MTPFRRRRPSVLSSTAMRERMSLLKRLARSLATLRRSASSWDWIWGHMLTAKAAVAPGNGSIDDFGGKDEDERAVFSRGVGLTNDYLLAGREVE